MTTDHITTGPVLTTPICVVQHVLKSSYIMYVVIRNANAVRVCSCLCVFVWEQGVSLSRTVEIDGQL